ncbi:MAG: TolC family protein, partial [Poseidonibacter sp.]|uniref:TolC family protein n=1 Tax=Poseidonibacter sp. TaxID=2321188 RepID=UPI00359D97DD
QIDIKSQNKDIKNLAKNTTLKYDNLEELINLALKQRAEIKKYQELIKTNKANIKNVKSQYYPTLDASASYTDKNSDDISSLETSQTAIMLNLKWNLFTGLSTSKDKKIAISNLSSTNKQLEQTKLQITQDITNAYFNMKQSFDSIKIGLLSLDLSIKNLNLANERYKAGLNDLLEVNDAKLEYTQAKNSLINSYYTHLSNNAQVKYELGIK